LPELDGFTARDYDLAVQDENQAQGFPSLRIKKTKNIDLVDSHSTIVEMNTDKDRGFLPFDLEQHLDHPVRQDSFTI